MAILSREEIGKLHRAIVSAQLITYRDVLLSGIDPAFVGTLKRYAASHEQVFGDLSALNAAGTLMDGTVPLATWLTNAIVLTESRRETQVFRLALDRVRARGIKAGSTGAPLYRSTTSWFWPLHIVLPELSRSARIFLAIQSIPVLMLAVGLFFYAGVRVTFQGDPSMPGAVIGEADPRFREVQERRFSVLGSRPDLLVRLEYPKEMCENETQQVMIAVQWDDRRASIGDHWAEVRSSAFDVSAPLHIERKLDHAPASFIWTITPKREGSHEVIVDTSIWNLPGARIFSFTADEYVISPLNGDPLVAKILVRTIWGISRRAFDGLVLLLGAIGILLAVPYLRTTNIVNIVNSKIGGLAFGKGAKGSGTINEDQQPPSRP